MHFFLMVVTALAACMSVTASCSPQFGTCGVDSDCCGNFRCDLRAVSMSSLLCF
ncbi:hypothetical protein P692DRAFT_20829862 [Suillus brevipes Sb2]|nr:hypothetical protein P692DRAFT_20829862 [Suillus brevipes Sb2]